MNFSFFMREVWRSLSRNAVPSFAAMASVLVTMLVLGAFIPVMQMASAAADQTRDRVFVSVFLKNDATSKDAARIRERLESTTNVKTVQYIPKAEALKEQKKLDPEAFKVLGSSNPLPDAFRVTPKDPDKIPQVHIRGDVNAPWRCIAGAIYNVHAAGYPTVGFISNPVDPNA